MTNANYQRIAGCSPRTATRDLNLLVGKGLIEIQGKGRGAYYLARKGTRHKCAKCAINGIQGT